MISRSPLRFAAAWALWFGIAIAMASGSARAADSAWNSLGAGNWSSNLLWLGSTIADGAGSTAWFTNNITAGRTITIDGAVSSRTNGVLNLGDADATSAFTIAASGGASLYLSNTSGNARFNELASSKGDTISAPLVLLSSLDLNNASSNTLTLSGGITAGTAGTKTITNLGGNTGTNLISGIIGDGAGQVALVQNSSTSVLRLQGANTFSGGLTINAGTVILSTSAQAGGGSGLGTIYLGDTSGTADATLLGTALSFTNAVVVRAGSSGVLTMGNSGNISTVFRGPITLNTNVTLLAAGSSASVNLSSNVTGVGGIMAAGNGGVTLGGSNSFSGGVTVNSATLTLANGSALGTGTFTIATNTTITGSSTVTLVTTNQQLWNSSFTVGSGNFNFTMGPGTVTLGTNVTVNVTTTPTSNLGFTVPGSITGAWSLVKAGVGYLRLGGSNSYTGGTTVDGGTLQVQNSDALGTGPVTINAGGLLLFNAGAISLTNRSATISGVGGVQLLNTSSTFTMLSSNAYSGGTLLSGNQYVRLANDSALGTGLITLNMAAAASSAITSTGSEARTLANALVFSNANTMTFGHVTDNGQLTFNGTIDLGGAVRSLSIASPVIFNGVISNGGFIKAGTGRLVLGGTNLFAGGILLSNGTISVSSDANLGGAGGVLSFAGGTLQVTGPAFTNLDSRSVNWGNFAGGLDIDAAANTFTVTNVLGGSGGLTKLGAGTLVLAGANANTGLMFVSNGVLTLSGSGQLGAPTANVLVGGTGATLDLGGLTRTNAVITLNTGVISNGTLAASSIFQLTNGVVSAILANGAGTPSALVKAGGGTVLLGGANTYSGGTTNSGGMLALGAENVLGSGSVFMNGGGLQSADGSARTLTNALVFTGNGIFGAADTGDLLINAPSVDLGAAVRTLTVSNNLVTIANAITNTGGLLKAGPGTLVLNGNNTYAGATTVNGGALVLNGDNSQLTNSFTIVSGSATNSGNLAPSGMNVGNTAGSTGTFTTVGGNFQSGNIRVGGANASSTASGTWNLFGGTSIVSLISVNYGGAGTLMMGGDNPRLVATSQILVGDVAFNSYPAQMVISNGYAATPLLRLGMRASSQGNLTIYGGTFEATGGGGDIYVGNSSGSTGTITLAGSSAMLVDTTTALSVAITLGNGDNSLGVLNVAAGSVFSRSISMGGGSNSLGRLTIGAGSVNVLPIYYQNWGSDANGVGELWMTDPGALLVTTNVSSQATYLGAYGTGRATISNGTWLANEITLARYAGAQGFVNLLGGRMIVNSNLTVGYGGYGSFIMTNGTLLELGRSLVVGTGNPTNSFRNLGGILQFATDAPTITPNGTGSIAVVDGVVSFRGVTNAAINGQITNITYWGANTLRLDASTNRASGAYAVSNGAAFSTLELVNDGATWQGPSLLIGPGGLLRSSNANTILAAVLTNSGTVSVINGQLTYLSNVVLNGGLFLTQNGTNNFTRGLDMAGGATLTFTSGNSRVDGAISSSGTINTINANVTFGGPLVISGSYISDPSTNIFTSNVTVTASGSMSGGNGDLFVFQQDFLNQSTNAAQFHLSQSAVLFSNSATHLLSVSNSGALDLGHFTNFAQVADNFSIGQLSIATGNRVTLAGNKDSLTNALYVGWLDIQGLAPGDTNSFLAVSNTLVTALNLPNINLYYDVYDSRNDWLTRWLPGTGYDLWSGGLLLPIPEPSPLLAVGAGLALLGLLRRRRGA